jgi:prepilin peptidase CpaA
LNASALLHLTPLLAMLGWASVTDFRSRRIRNWLTLTMMVTGFMQSFTPIHVATPGGSALGFLVGFGVTFILFALGAIGGGDVKLIAGVGAWVGPIGAMQVFLLEAIIGMVIVLIQAAWQGRLTLLLHNSMLLTINLVHLQDVGIDHVTRTGQAARSVDRPLPYAIPVFLAVATLAIKSYVTHGV